ADPVIALISVNGDQRSGPGLPWDLDRPLDASCAVDFVPSRALGDFSASTESAAPAAARDALWHSAAHLLGWSLESLFGDRAFLTDGPAVKPAASAPGIGGGFFYDVLLSETGPDVVRDRLALLPPAVSPADLGQLAAGALQDDLLHLLRQDPTDDLRRLMRDAFPASDTHLADLTARMRDLAAASSPRAPLPFRRLPVARDTARLMFFHSPFKLALLNRIPPTDRVVVYRCGDFVDLCRGPHVPDVGLLREARLLRTGAALWN
ncbi:54S ribosomal protein L39, mitochondrial, partial [Cladochytrium tenue]